MCELLILDVMMSKIIGCRMAGTESILWEYGGKIWAESSAGINTFHVRLRLI